MSKLGGPLQASRAARVRERTPNFSGERLDYIVAYLSKYMSLQSGDIISTGTPPGVGMGQKPPIYLKSGDKIRLGIQGLGEQNQTVISS